jgi:hypothetical protein
MSLLALPVHRVWFKRSIGSCTMHILKLVSGSIEGSAAAHCYPCVCGICLGNLCRGQYRHTNSVPEPIPAVEYNTAGRKIVELHQLKIWNVKCNLAPIVLHYDTEPALYSKCYVTIDELTGALNGPPETDSLPARWLKASPAGENGSGPACGAASMHGS